MAMESETKSALKHEAEVYACLNQVDSQPGGGIPNLVGLFDDLDGGLHVLVTIDVGESLDYYTEPLNDYQR
jgi:hypothetical protein